MSHLDQASLICFISMADPEGGRGSGPTLQNHKNIGFPSNTGPGPWKLTRLPSQHSMLGHHLHDSETPFKWRIGGGPMLACLWLYLDRLSPHQLSIRKRQSFWQNILYPRMVSMGSSITSDAIMRASPFIYLKGWNYQIFLYLKIFVI